jgi:hypothetical protein
VSRAIRALKTRTCLHCKEEIEEGAHHDCWTTTEAQLTRGLSEDLMDAWERLRETATEFGDQRIYASHHSIMFSRKVCYFFVRPQKSFLEIWFFLGRTVKDPRIRKTVQSSSVKVAHQLRVSHRDEVEPPITAWLKEAYSVCETLRASPKPRTALKRKAAAKKRGPR